MRKADLERALADALDRLEKSRVTCETIAAQKNSIIDGITEEKETWRNRALRAEEQAHRYNAARYEAERAETSAREEAEKRGEAIKALEAERDDLKSVNARLTRENAVLTATCEKQNRWIEWSLIAGTKVPT